MLFLAILVLIIVVAAFFWIKYFPLGKDNKIDVDKPKLGIKVPSKVLGDSVQSPINNFFNQTKDSLQETSQNVLNSVKDQVYNQTQNTVNTIFDKSNPTIVTIKITEVSSPPPGSFTIDFLKDSNLKLNLNKGSKYYLQFKNIPSDYCLYIGDNKYQITSSKITEVQFNSNGTYPIRLNFCEVNDKNLGELVVQ